MSLEKETSRGEIQSSPSTSVWEGMAHMLDDCGLRVCTECTATVAKKWSEWPCRGLASTVDRLLATEAQLEAEA